jgi:RNA polymerase sigma-70 factor, ECF subfamily
VVERTDTVTADSDATLVERVRHGDEAAFAVLYARYQPVVARRLRRVLGAGPDVEDVVQMTFVTAHRTLARYERERPFGPWLHGIAFRVTANLLRSRRRRAWLSWGARDDGPDRGPTTEENVATKQLLGHLYAALDQLPAEKRIAFVMHELEGLGLTEIGELCGESPQTIRARVASAREAILRYFRRHRAADALGRSR